MVPWALFALLIGLALGYALFYDPPTAALVRERQTVQAQQQQIAQLNGRLAAVESELSQRNPEAAALVGREIALNERAQDLGRREEAVAARERELTGRWTLPRVDFPSAEDVIAFFNGVGQWFSETFNADASLDIATRPGGAT